VERAGRTSEQDEPRPGAATTPLSAAAVLLSLAGVLAVVELMLRTLLA
jgi:hypothetical protein